VSSTTITRLGSAGRGVAAAVPRLRLAMQRMVSASGSWRRYATPMGVAGVVGGFAVVIQSWWDSTTTPDARVELQDVISAIGGGALVVAGMLLIVGEVFMSLRRTSAAHMEQIAGALTQMAAGNAAAQQESGTAVSPSSVVLATHASYHAPACDLVLGRDGVRVTTLSDAHAQGLTPCRTCLGGGAR
jgi:hypothetical protein